MTNLDIWLMGMGAACIVGGFAFWAIYRAER